MLGLFENIGYAIEPIGLAIEGAFVKARCEVANHIVDVKCRRKIKKYAKMQRESGDEELEVEEESAELEEPKTPENYGGRSIGMIAKTFSSTLMPRTEHERNNYETEEDNDGCTGN